ncbi:hypothetical protein EQZ23_18320 [Sphingomonas sp. UV9]|uniref:FecR family protein n=1 Tax=Sphingomonas sp. UV9 TaxID=1851410 RepID=UPI000FFC5BE9|nr:FecR domain-containing protein [Sphingomonas sp. UV9]RXD02574.1 hypothetical protein EQZ23_18320 [Sphingomonas sp. UV9]
MSDESHDPAMREALDWAAHMQAADFDDWEAHIEWLEADATHPALYRRATKAMSAGLSMLQPIGAGSVPLAANDTEENVGTHRPQTGWWAGAGVALAATITAFFILPHQGAEPARSIRTAPGASRNVTLADGTSLTLNGDTQVTVADAAQRRIVLHRGEVFLRVVHDAEHPFEVVVGDRLFRDVGTEFNISMQSTATRLTVAEGAVALDPDGANLRIDAGDAVTIMGAQVVIGKVASRNVGSWREGRLVYANDRVDRVASDLTRSLGVSVVVSPRLADERFTGVLPLRQGPGEVVRRLADLLQASAVKTESGWSVDVKQVRDGTTAPYSSGR